MKTFKVIMRVSLLIIFVAAIVAVACKDNANDVNPQEDSAVQSTIFGAGNNIATVQSTDLDEASGLAHSRSNANFLWSHNDSGGDAELFLLNFNGADAGRYRLEGASSIDWEDMTIGAGPDNTQSYIYVGDIGDNRAQRASCTIYRLVEPDLTGINLPPSTSISDYESIDYIYEDGARDAEALMVDPLTKDIFIVSKREPSNIVYKLAYPQNTTAMDTAVLVAVLPYTFITAGDISADGTEVLLKNYLNVYYWKKESNESLEDLFKRAGTRLNYTAEPQGEAIAFSTDGTSYLTVSELGNASEVNIINYTRN